MALFQTIYLIRIDILTLPGLPHDHHLYRDFFRVRCRFLIISNFLQKFTQQECSLDTESLGGKQFGGTKVVWNGLFVQGSFISKNASNGAISMILSKTHISKVEDADIWLFNGPNPITQKQIVIVKNARDGTTVSDNALCQVQLPTHAIIIPEVLLLHPNKAKWKPKNQQNEDGISWICNITSNLTSHHITLDVITKHHITSHQWKGEICK
jgi:hypothetical protein